MGKGVEDPASANYARTNIGCHCCCHRFNVIGIEGCIGRSLASADCLRTTPPHGRIVMAPVPAQLKVPRNC